MLAVESFAQETDTRAESDDSSFKVAVIDMQSLVKGYRKTLVAEQEVDLKRAEIQKKNQLATNHVLNLKKKIEDRLYQARLGNSSDEEVATLHAEMPILRRELQVADNQREKARIEENTTLNQQMIRRMSAILEELVGLTAKKAEEMGFDIVIDISGTTTNQVAPILFAKNATDITDLMRKELSKSRSSQR